MSTADNLSALGDLPEGDPSEISSVDESVISHGDEIPDPAAVAVGGHGGQAPPDPAVDAAEDHLSGLPGKVCSFFERNVPLEAQKDVAKVLKSRGITTPTLLAMLDDTVCSKLASVMEDDTNIIFLKAIGKIYSADDSAPRGRKSSREETSLAEESIRRYQSAFKAKHGVSIPGRFLVEGKVLNSIKKGEAPRLAECDTLSPDMGKRRKIELGFEKGRVGWQFADSPRPPPQCEAAQFGLSLIRFCLSASLLGRMSPAEALIFMARVYEVGEMSSLANMKALEYAMRIEAVRGGGNEEPFGAQVATKLSDTVASYREVGRASAAVANTYKSAQRADRPVCRLFMQGKCNWGANCRFYHPRRGSPDDSRDYKGPKKQAAPKQSTGTSH